MARIAEGYRWSSTPATAGDAELEDPDVAVLQVVASWRDTVLSTHHLSPPRAFTIGAADADLVGPFECASIVQIVDGRVAVTAPGAPRVFLAVGDHASVELEGFSFDVRLVANRAYDDL